MAVVVRIVALVMVVVLVAPRAFAATPEGNAQAREHFQKGQVHYDLKEYGPALEQFKNAYRYLQDPVLLYNIAQCHYYLEQYDEALGFYRDYLRRVPNAANKSAVERKIQDAEKRLASAPKSPPPAPAPPAMAPPPVGVAAPPAPKPPASVAKPEPSPAPAPPAASPPAAPPARPPVAFAPPPASPDPALPTPSPALTAAVTAPAPEPESPSIFKRWWFWTAVGAVVLGGVVITAGAMKSNQVGDCMSISPCVKVGGK